MNPDEQIAQDLSIGVLLFILGVTMFALLKDYGGYLPEDECANRVIESLSPYQVSQLTDSSYPFKYHEDHPALIIENPIINHSSFIMNNAKPNVFFSDYIGRRPIPTGHMIFFPSYLYHYHPPFKQTDMPRKSVAFNLFPNETFGVNDSKLVV